ncbi:hypothetical protein ACI77O_12190 [Pseudomonas tritici]|uniref:hypothetical protein n=1 Tax=Pseudomonas tritici TaxID=2745518 RepID=UPI00387AD4B7
MALHYTISTAKTACGRTATSANATSITDDVTCKTCCKSEVFVAALPAAATAPAPAAVPAPAAPVAQAPKAKRTTQLKSIPALAEAPTAQGSGVVFGEWRSLLGSNDRLPRGKFFARQRRHERAA